MIKALFLSFIFCLITTYSYGKVRQFTFSYLPGIQAINFVDSNSKEKAKYSNLLKAGEQDNSFGVQEFSPIFFIANTQFELTPGVSLNLDLEFNQYTYQITKQSKKKEASTYSGGLGVNFNSQVTESIFADFGTSIGIKSAKYSLMNDSEHTLVQMTLNVWVHIHYLGFTLKLVNTLAALGLSEVNGLGALKDSSFSDSSLSYTFETTSIYSIAVGAFINHDHTELFGSVNPEPLNAYMIDDLTIGAQISMIYKPKN